MQKYVRKHSLLNCNENDLPDVTEVIVAKPLLNRLKNSEGVTMKRSKESSVQTLQKLQSTSSSEITHSKVVKQKSK